MTVLTSQQLNKILDINAKSVEIYLEVEGKYNEILEDIEEMKKIIDNMCTENKEHVKDQYIHIERMKMLTEKLQEIVDNNCKSLIKQNAEILAYKTEIISYKIDIISDIGKLEKGITRQNYIFGGTIISAIVAAIIKLLLGTR
jgi:hypothetical protein